MKVIDAGVAKDISNPKIIRKTNWIWGKNLREPAMTAKEVQKAIRFGGEFAKVRRKMGANVIGLGTIGVGGEFVADVLLSRLLEVESAALVKREANEERRKRKLDILETIRQTRGPRSSVLEELLHFSGFELMMVLEPLSKPPKKRCWFWSMGM